MVLGLAALQSYRYHPLAMVDSELCKFCSRLVFKAAEEDYAPKNDGDIGADEYGFHRRDVADLQRSAEFSECAFCKVFQNHVQAHDNSGEYTGRYENLVFISEKHRDGFGLLFVEMQRHTPALRRKRKRSLGLERETIGPWMIGYVEGKHKCLQHHGKIHPDNVQIMNQRQTRALNALIGNQGSWN